jgi:hypothetical protein
LRLDKGWRAREVRTWREDDETTPTPRAIWPSLGSLVAQRFQSVEEQLLVVEKILQGRLSLEYVCWNGKTDVLLPADLL